MKQESSNLVGITRHVQKGLCGWNVRICHEKETYMRYFADIKNGGESSALQKAIEYRDQTVAKLPEKVQQRIQKPRRTHPSSGVAGVTFVVCEALGREYRYWQSSKKTETGSVKRKFSVNKYGFEQAKEMAIRALAGS